MTGAAPTPKLLVLPRESTKEARIVTLAHPRTSKSNRYFFDPTHGICEFTRIAASKDACQSWLLKSQSGNQLKRKKGEELAATVEKTSDRAHDDAGLSSREHTIQTPPPHDYVIKNPELLVATPIDPLYILLPALTDRKLFLSADDLLDHLSERSVHFTHILSTARIRKQMEARMKVVCDIVLAGDEDMYRLNEEKLLAELVLKAEKMVASGLPASMEEHFIRRALEAPLAIIKREESSASVNGIHTSQSEDTAAESMESQASMSSIDLTSSVGSSKTDVTIPDDFDANYSRNLHHLLRLRTALSYMLFSYVPPVLAISVTARMASENSPVDFKPLDNRLAEVSKLRADALAARSLGDFSRKRNMHEEDDAIEGRLEKKRRKEEEEKKKKAGETRGARDLKKVDTKGMKKMSDFFGKRTSPRKKV